MSITTINAYAVTRQGGPAEPFSYQKVLGSNDVLVRVTHCRFDFILSTLNTKFDLNACLGMLKPQGKLCVVA